MSWVRLKLDALLTGRRNPRTAPLGSRRRYRFRRSRETEAARPLQPKKRGPEPRLIGG